MAEAANGHAAPGMSGVERRWALASAIASVTVFGLGVGQGSPLLSLLLEQRGTDPGLNGLNAASTFLGVLAGPLLTPPLVRRMGIRSFLLTGFLADAAVFSATHVFDSYGAWMVLRIVMGLLGSSIFTASEAWINLLAGDAQRGRVLGLYAAALSAGFGLGPLILMVTGVNGWAPFLVNNAISIAATFPLLFVGDRARDLGRERGPSPLRMFRRAPLILLAVGMFGVYETAMMALLPVWGVRTGLSVTLAASLLAALYLGSILQQVGIGWLSDRVGRAPMLLACGLTGLAGAAALATIPASVPMLLGLLFIWGGITFGIYPVALGMAGDRFRGGDMVAVNVAIIIAYGLGALLGPSLGGVAMDLWGAPGLPWMLVGLFAAFIAAIRLGRLGRPSAA